MKAIFLFCFALFVSACGGAAKPTIEANVYNCATPFASIPITLPALKGLPVRVVKISATISLNGVEAEAICVEQFAAPSPPAEGVSVSSSVPPSVPKVEVVVQAPDADVATPPAPSAPSAATAPPAPAAPTSAP